MAKRLEKKKKLKPQTYQLQLKKITKYGGHFN